MKRFERKFLSTYNLILTALLSMLGFSNCTIVEPKDEYGSPSATFKVNGKVTDLLTNRAIQDIKVLMQGDSTQTDSEGRFSLSQVSFPADQSFVIQFKDIDGAANGGQFQPKDTLVEFKDPQFTNGDGSWYQGETSLELNLNLEPEE
ncbi:MAG: radical SAM-associated putative lipoprotein [Salinivirgaceae bacterium]|jgi:putative lipoprotein (rSAM/lipoprotein system)